MFGEVNFTRNLVVPVDLFDEISQQCRLIIYAEDTTFEKFFVSEVEYMSHARIFGLNLALNTSILDHIHDILEYLLTAVECIQFSRPGI